MRRNHIETRSALLALLKEIYQWPVESPQEWSEMARDLAFPLFVVNLDDLENTMKQSNCRFERPWHCDDNVCSMTKLEA